MKIRTKLILNYSFLSISLLIVFLLIFVFIYIKYREADFKIRLHNRASTSLNMFLNRSTIDSATLRVIDESILTTMKNLKISIYNSRNRLVYKNWEHSSLANANGNTPFSGLVGYFYKVDRSITFKQVEDGHVYTVNAFAYDIYGLNELSKLLGILFWVIILSILFIAGFGFYNAVWSLKPFRNVIGEVESVDPSDLKKRLSVKGSDEISQLSQAFNKLLDRIENAFETEKSFISNASHELRTPVTSIMGQIDVALNKPRTESEYKTILESVYEDSSQLATIINGFLELAETNLASNQIKMAELRIDELIFSIVDEFERRKPAYSIMVEFISNPDNDYQMECEGNERLLKLMFSNLIDNACKYSEDKKARLKIDFTNQLISVSIIDNGIGIPAEDLSNVFLPLYRGTNASNLSGHGIGLAVVKRIADLHQIGLSIHSEINVGTIVKVTLHNLSFKR